MSCLSGAAVVEAAQRSGYQVRAVGIARDGSWVPLAEPPATAGGRLPSVTTNGKLAHLIRAEDGVRLVTVVSGTREWLDSERIDVLFPALHGTNGDDGRVQGMCEVLGLPYVGARCTTCTLAANKALTNPILRTAGLPRLEHWTVQARSFDPEAPGFRLPRMTGPLVVKPATEGLGDGVRICRTTQQVHTALTELATSHDEIVVERYLTGARELECVALVDAEPTLYGPGEVKYQRTEWTVPLPELPDRTLVCPADVPPATRAECRRLAWRVIEVLSASGLVRVDFFLAPDGQLYVNEVTAMPGLQPGSMAQQLWAASALSLEEAIPRLLRDGLRRGAAGAGTPVR